LAREQRGQGKSAIELDAEHGAFAREGLDDAPQPVARAGMC
jgi:hypothetical protein